jgi:hypothetical protein
MCLNEKQARIDNIELRFYYVVFFIVYTILVGIVAKEFNKPLPTNNKDAEIQKLRWELMKANSKCQDTALHKNCIRVGI